MKQPKVSTRGMLDFSGKTVVVTGGVGLIGREVTSAFLECGGSVVVADVDQDRHQRLFEKARLASFQRMDITDPRDVEAGLRSILERLQKIDVWVNCAYPRTADWGKSMDEVSFGSWDENVRMHLGGYFYTSKLVLEAMKPRRSGCLINFGSTYGVLGPHFDIYEGTRMTTPVAYSAIKGGIVTMSKYLAALYGPYNIRVNCICPGGVFDNHDPGFVERYAQQTPLKRMARSQEIAMPVVFLASDAASYITGHTLMVDGGWSAW